MSERYKPARVSYEQLAADYWDLQGEMPIANPFPWWRFRIVSQRKEWLRDLQRVIGRVRSGEASKDELLDYSPSQEAW